MCHRTGFTKSCFECVTQHGCQLWRGLHGKNPNTGELITEYNCQDALVLMGQLEIANMIQRLDLTLENFRNETLRIGTADVIRQAEAVIEEARQNGALVAPQVKAIGHAKS